MRKIFNNSILIKVIKTLNKRSTFFIFALATIVSFIAVWHWFSGNSILYFWDAYLPFDPQVSFGHLFYLWREGLFPGYASASWSWVAYWVIFFLPYAVFHSLSISELILYILLLSFSTINFYFLASHILGLIVDEDKQKTLIKISALGCALLYTFNTYTFSNFYFMFNPGSFILAFLPLNLLALIQIYPLDSKKMLKKSTWWLVIFFASLVLMIPGFTVYVFFLQYVIWIFVYLFAYWIIFRPKIISKETLETILFFLLIVFVNLWWFIPAFLGMKESYAAQSSFGTTVWFDNGFEPSKLLNAFRLIGSGLMINNTFSWSPLYESNNLFTFPLFVFPFLFLLSLVFLKKNIKNVLIFFLIMTTVSLFIVKFSNPPFAWILGFAYHYVPFFGGFRDAFQKSGIYFMLGYFIFISAGFVLTVNYLNKERRKFLIGLLIAIITVGAVILSGPFFLFMKDNIRTMQFTYDKRTYQISAKTQIPNEYYGLKNFLENKCSGETILNIPRSGFISDGVWQKYKTSYVGQDILPGLINCNFISTAMFTSESEDAIQVPYLFLQQNDIVSFKNYLGQNNINYILIRKDFVPDNLVSWTYVDPIKAEKILLKDGDFSKIYTNDFFIVFRRNMIVTNQYGFSLTHNVIYRPDLLDGASYAVVSRMMGDLGPSILLSSPLYRNQYANKSTIFTSIGNCIGCTKIDTTKFISEVDTSFMSRVKNYIKMILHRNVYYPTEIQISLDIIKVHGVYSQIVTAIESQDKENFYKKIDEYVNLWSTIRNLSNGYNADKFSRNNKFIEIVNFLSIERNSTYNEFSSEFFKDKKFISDLVSKQKFVLLLNFQTDLLNGFSKNIIEADLENGAIPLRLDIPKDGAYTCEPQAIKNNVNFTSLSIEGYIATIPQIEGNAPINLKKGSYLTRLTFSPKEVIDIPSLTQVNDQVRKIKLGHLDPGSYKISFESEFNSYGKMVMVVSQGEISKNLLENLSSNRVLGRNIYMVDIVDHNLNGTNKFERNFGIDLVSSQDYYLYLQSIIPEHIPAEITNLNVSTTITGGGDIQLVCITNPIQLNRVNETIKVEKESPVKYLVKLPKHYQGYLIFNQSADPNWVAHAESGGPNLPHFISGYANSWYVENLKDNNLVIEYTVQNLAIRTAIISLILSFVLAIVYLKVKK
jgi:hypothetical protein